MSILAGGLTADGSLAIVGCRDKADKGYKPPDINTGAAGRGG